MLRLVSAFTRCKTARLLCIYTSSCVLLSALHVVMDHKPLHLHCRFRVAASCIYTHVALTCIPLLHLHVAIACIPILHLHVMSGCPPRVVLHLHLAAILAKLTPCSVVKVVHLPLHLHLSGCNLMALLHLHSMTCIAPAFTFADGKPTCTYTAFFFFFFTGPPAQSTCTYMLLIGTTRPALTLPSSF